MSKRYKADSQAARSHVYATNGAGACPYPEGSRLARLWAKWRAHYWNMELVLDDMAQVYGNHKEG